MIMNFSHFSQVVLIFGICGAMRSGELPGILMQHVEDTGRRLVVDVHELKKEGEIRVFVIEDIFYNPVKEYMSLRPSQAGTERFFLNYADGKCTRQVIGKNKFAQMPREIATFLELPEAKKYTGHAFRRTSATLLADSGASMTTLMRHGGWKSPACAQRYVANSIEQKRKVFNQIVDQCRPSTSRDDSNEDQVPAKRRITENDINILPNNNNDDNGNVLPDSVVDSIDWNEPFDSSPPKSSLQSTPLKAADQNQNRRPQTVPTPATHSIKSSTTGLLSHSKENINTPSTIENVTSHFLQLTNCTIHNLTVNIQKQNDL